MRILDTKGNVLVDPDLELGRLEADVLETQHPAEPETPRKTKRVEMSNDGKGNVLFRTEVIQPYVPPKPAWVEKESIYRYVPYTPEELVEIAEQKAAAEAEAADAAAEAEHKAELQRQIEALPGQMETVIEAVAEVGGAVGENDALIAAIRSDLDDTMEAIAELGTLVAGEE